MTQIESLITEYKTALNQCLEASKAEEDAKIKKMAAHKKLSLIQDELRNITNEIKYK